MWTDENRSLYERKGVRYPSDLTDREWALIEALIPPAKRGGRPRQVNVREVMNGVLYVLATGCQWRALPKDLPAKSTVHRPHRHSLVLTLRVVASSQLSLIDSMECTTGVP